MDESTTWGTLFSRLGLAPGKLGQRVAFSVATVMADCDSAAPRSTVSERISLLSGLLEPFFFPAVTSDDVFAIAAAGESSGLMFNVFQERPQIAGVLHLCKQLKAAPVLILANEGPKRIVQILAGTMGSSHQRSTLASMTDEIVTYFNAGAAREQAELVRTHLLQSGAHAEQHIDLYLLATSFPAWELLSRESSPLAWAARHDELAVLLKNIPGPGIEARQRRAVSMMQEAIEVFEAHGAVEDAAIAKSNLGNVLSDSEWLTAEDRLRRALRLYEEALHDARNPRFRARILDNIAGLHGKLADAGVTDRREGLAFSIKALEAAEDAGDSERIGQILGNAIKHLVSLRDETTTRREDLNRARDLATRVLTVLDQIPTNERGSLLESLADLWIRSTDYEPAERERLAREALDFLHRADQLGHSARDSSAAYVRAQASRILGDHSSALATISKVIDAIESPASNGVFACQACHFQYETLVQCTPQGAPQRIAAAERWAHLARDHASTDKWAEAEAFLLQELLYSGAASRKSATVEPGCERAESVLSQVAHDSPGAVRLQGVLVTAHAVLAPLSRRPDELVRSLELLQEASARLKADDRIVAGTNVLASWISLLSITGGGGFDAASARALIVALRQDLAEALSNAPQSSHELHRLREVEYVMKAASLLTDFLDAEERSVGDVDSTLNSFDNFVDQTETATKGSNFHWIRPCVLELAAHVYAAHGRYTAAIERCERALRLLPPHDDDRVRRGQEQRIQASIYYFKACENPAAAISLVAASSGRAAAWTLQVHRRGRDVHEDVRMALLAMERLEIAHGTEAGQLLIAEPISVAEATIQANSANEKLSALGVPSLDGCGLDLAPEASLSADTVVVLVHGRYSGRAVVVRGGCPVADASSVPLPEYCTAFANALVYKQWLPALLSWRKDANGASFDASIRRISVALWRAVFAPLQGLLGEPGSPVGVRLVVMEDQALLPWSCASPTKAMTMTASDAWDLSLAFDLNTVVLGEERRRSCQRQRSAGVGFDSNALFHALVTKPFLGFDSAVLDRLISGERLRMLSITDTIGDLPMTRLESAAAARAFRDVVITLEGGIHPMVMPFLAQLMSGPDILHFACHGVWKPFQPWLSSIRMNSVGALSGASVRGRLTLDGQVVVLSACESGVPGPGAAGEGGLPQAFLLAGADAVVASSWMVHDLSSLVFVDAMFRSLSAGESLAAAMRNARGVMRSMSHDALRNAIEPLFQTRPETAEALKRALDALDPRNPTPISSPLHWAAQFTMMA